MITVKHDGSFDVATGASRTNRIWKNTKITWSEFLAKLENPIRTKESVAEYNGLSKEQKKKLKDVGGFVGGMLKNGRRTPGTVAHRQLITLDADFADDSFLSVLDIMYGHVAYMVYSTRSHTDKAPKYRVIIPLAKPVQPDAYQAISRRIADDLGLDCFDNTTYQVERLMYWPSCSNNGAYVFNYNDAPWVEPEAVLRTYVDWKDSTTWPVQGAAININDAKKQQNPLEKTGIIGAFCRCYDIHSTIAEFLPDVYETCSTPDRYTFKNGTAAAGLVVYDSIFAYSHHGTDLISCKLVNAFDLVRTHKFSHLDAKTDEDTAVTKKPSYTAMCEFATKLESVKKELLTEKISKANEIFGDEDPETDSDEWVNKLKINSKTGKLESLPENIKLILKHDPRIKNCLSKDLLANRIVLKKDLPWRTMDLGTHWNDIDDSCLRNFFSEAYNIAGKGIIDDGFRQVVELNVFHPIRDYLRSLEWDGVPRADRLFIDYLGAPDSDYVKAVTRKHLLAAVHRVMNPGVKYDTVIVLVGPQGLGKSVMVNRLGQDWFSDSLSGMQGKEALEQLRGSWIIELSEMYVTRKAENEAIKSFLSKQSDRYREAYGRRIEEFPRQCIFFGTTNDEQFLRDRTGNRRFWPISCAEHRRLKVAYDDLNKYEVDQVWAEMFKAWQEGETLFLDKDIQELAKEAQEEHTEESEKKGMILEYLDTKLPENWPEMDIYERRNYLRGGEIQLQGTVERSRVCALEVWCELFDGDPKNLTGIASREINDILRGLDDWEQLAKKEKMRFGKMYGHQRGFLRKTDKWSSLKNKGVH